MLALVAVASRSHDTPGGRAGIHEPPRGVGNYVFSIFIVMAVATMLVMMWYAFTSRDLLAEQHRRRTTRGRARSAFVFIFVALVFALAMRANIFKEFSERFQRNNGSVRGGQPTDTNKKKPADPGDTAQAPEFKWLPVFFATAGAMVLLGFIGVRSARRERAGVLEPYLLEQEFEALLEDTLADLYAEKDPRKAIIAAYARMERLFATYGIPRRPTEAPVEYLERVLGELRASGSALRRLTALFQWAKFSDHAVDASMRDEAIQALTRVRDELKANRVEDEARRAELERRQADLADAYDDGGQTFGADPFETAGEKARGSLEGRRTN
jgi:hypothetical protein